MSDIKDLFVKEVEKALGSDLKWFAVTAGDVCDDDPEFYSMAVIVKPKDFEYEGVPYRAERQELIMQLDDGVPHVILGEDELHEVTKLQIYQDLYWDLAFKS